MRKTFYLLSLTGAALLCGCGKQTKINTAEIEILSQKMVQLQENQAKQMAALQLQLTSLAPMLDKINSTYFEKTHEDAFFYHTNQLFLLLTVDQKIESELQVADAEREAESSLAHSYHTNEMDMLHFYTAQIQDAMAGQESRIEDKVNAETRRVGANLSDELVKQIKLSAPDAVETARRRQMEADVAQMKRELDQIKVLLGQMTNPPAARP
jgi:hypothetical protein